MQLERETDLMGKGKIALNKGEYQQAQAYFSEVVQMNDKNAEAFFYLANIFHLNGEVGKAIKAFKIVLRLDPCHTDAAISLSVLYNDIGRYEEAKVIFERANERVKQRKTGAAVEDTHVNKKFAYKHYELAEMYLTYQRFDEALFEYNKAIGLDPDNLEARIKLAKTYAKKGFMSKAFDELRKLKNEHPGHLPARVALGILYYGNGKIIEAQQEWEKVLSKDPHHKEAAMYLNLSKTASETSL